MMDDVEDAPPPPPAAPSPALQNFQGAFTDPVAQDWAGDSAAILNDYFQRRDIADASERAGQNFVNNLDQFKTGLTSFVQNDPNAVHVALDLVPHTVSALVGTSGVENPEDHATAVTDHIQHEIAATAVTSAAEHHEGLARGMLANERISGILGDSTGPLDTYISVQAAARATDHQAQVDQLQRDAARGADRSMGNYAGALVDPAGGVRFPDGWNQGVMADPKVPPAAKVALVSMYDSLQANGDAAQSDPHIVSAITQGIAGGGDANVARILGEAGGSLKLQDAMMLAGMPKAGAIQLHNALEQGRAALATPENGRAGEEAYAKFANWLLPAARNGAQLDPSSPDYVLPATRLNGFAPTAASMVDVAYRKTGSAATLSEIFSNPEYRKPTRSSAGPSRIADGPPQPGDEVVGRGSYEAWNERQMAQARLVRDTDRRDLVNHPDPNNPGQWIIERQSDVDRRALGQRQPRASSSATAGPEPGDEILGGGQPMVSPSANLRAASRSRNANARPRRR
jgi:hypothetical protein